MKSFIHASSAPAVADFPGRVEISVEVPVVADRDRAFAALTQWAEQGRWMVGTKVWPSRGSGREVGDELSGFSGVGKIGFLDTMDIERFDDEWVVVQHTGRVVRGAGWMGVPRPAPGQPVKIVWGEALDLPLGGLGRVGWLLVGPIMVRAVRRSLRQLAALVERGELPVEN